MNQEIDKKTTQDAWLHEHTLSLEQFKRLIQNKLDRALAMSHSVKQHESLTWSN